MNGKKQILMAQDEFDSVSNFVFASNLKLNITDHSEETIQPFHRLRKNKIFWLLLADDTKKFDKTINECIDFNFNDVAIVVRAVILHEIMKQRSWRPWINKLFAQFPKLPSFDHKIMGNPNEFVIGVHLGILVSLPHMIKNDPFNRHFGNIENNDQDRLKDIESLIVEIAFLPLPEIQDSYLKTFKEKLPKVLEGSKSFLNPEKIMDASCHMLVGSKNSPLKSSFNKKNARTTVQLSELGEVMIDYFNYEYFRWLTPSGRLIMATHLINQSVSPKINVALIPNVGQLIEKLNLAK